MKKTYLVTLNDNKFNYGNRLQNLASLYVLRKCGFDPYTLSFFKKESIVLLFLKFLFSTNAKKRKIFKKKIMFRLFENKQLLKKSFKINHKLECDYIFIGSDQVWNTTYWNKGDENIYLLRFIDDTSKVALAPSFGNDVIEEKYNELFSTELRKYTKLSCRETSGCKYVEGITGLECELIIDPTLALTKDEWLKFVKPITYKRKYLLVYCLGQMGEQMEHDISKISKVYDLEVHRINDARDSFYLSDPARFLSAIMDAEIIITDSYHCSIFSVIFDKPFYVYQRIGDSEKMYNRIDDFLKRYILTRKNSKFVNIDNKVSVFECDYSDSKKLIMADRNNFYRYIKSCK